MVITNLDGAVTSAFAHLYVLTPSYFASQPLAFPSVSLGAKVSNRVLGGGTPPLAYQWLLNGAPVAGQTRNTLLLTNLQSTDAGSYACVVTNLGGSVTSHVAVLSIDLAFTKVTAGAIVTDMGLWGKPSWADYNGSGYLSLFVPNSEVNGSTAITQNGLYRNNGDGTFTKVTTGRIVTDGGSSTSGAWADYDNDGFPDLFVSVGGSDNPTVNFLYHNQGDGTFNKVTAGSVVNDNKVTLGAGAWADYNNDGFVDLFVTDAGFCDNGTLYNHNSLYRNDGGSVFTEIGTGIIVDYKECSVGGAWRDYDNDGWPDLYVVSDVGVNLLYRNNRDGTFMSITSAGIGTDSPSKSVGCFWGDYDNDGFPDLFVSNGGAGGTPTSNFLFHNNGDGTFGRITSGRIVSDIGNFIGCAWGDYDNDGFLDLYVSNGAYQNGDQSNFLYRNNGNSNAWIKVKLVGTVSNRSAIGAKVRVQATIRGRTITQLREISSLDGLLAHFGLGDATNAETLRIEWPSGIIQTLTNVEPRQTLTVVEHQAYDGTAPAFGTSIVRPNELQLSVTEPTAGAVYDLETSTDLAKWTKLMAHKSTGNTFVYTDTSAGELRALRFYRIVVP